MNNIKEKKKSNQENSFKKSAYLTDPFHGKWTVVSHYK